MTVPCAVYVSAHYGSARARGETINMYSTGIHHGVAQLALSGAILFEAHVAWFARCQNPNRPTMATASKPHHAPVVLHVRRASGRAAEVAARRKGPVEEQLH